MDSIKCKGCAKSFPINGIRTHIRQTSCKNQFTSAEYDQLVKLCESHKRKKNLKERLKIINKRKFKTM